MGIQRLKVLSNSLQLSQATGKKMDQKMDEKQSSQDKNCHSYGLLVLQVGGLGSWATVPAPAFFLNCQNIWGQVFIIYLVKDLQKMFRYFY